MAGRAKLSTVVAKGDLRLSLEALRDRLAAEVELAEPRVLAALAKQLSDVLKALAALPSGKEETLDDELARRRAGRRTSTGASDGSEKPGESGNGRGHSGGGRRT